MKIKTLTINHPIMFLQSAIEQTPQISVIITALTGLIAAIFTGLAAFMSSKTQAKQRVHDEHIQTLEESLLLRERDIASLNEKIAKYEGNIETLTDLVKSYQQTIKEKDIIISQKNVEIDKLNVKIDKLIGRIETLEKKN